MTADIPSDPVLRRIFRSFPTFASIIIIITLNCTETGRLTGMSSASCLTVVSNFPAATIDVCRILNRSTRSGVFGGGYNWQVSCSAVTLFARLGVRDVEEWSVTCARHAESCGWAIGILLCIGPGALEMPMALVADNVELFYSDHGQGPPVLMLHGWTCDGADWSWLAGDLAVDHRVVVVDFRGHGRSTRTVDPYGAQVLANDMVRVLQHLSIDRVVVVGHSMGTTVVPRWPSSIRTQFRHWY
jgi:alpha/beta hydrolase family protein